MEKQKIIVITEENHTHEGWLGNSFAFTSSF